MTSEFDLVKAAAHGIQSVSRVVQTAAGTWLASWHGVPGNTPPIEKRDWFCVACFQEQDAQWRKIPPMEFIKWKEAAKQLGSEDAHAAYNLIKNHRPVLLEHVKDVEELNLKSKICCKVCQKKLNSATEALVEVF